MAIGRPPAVPGIILGLMLLAVELNDWGHQYWLGTESQPITLAEAVERITPEDQREWLTYLASPELDGRVPNRLGYGKAVGYVEAKCKSWGLETERQTVPNRDQNLFAYIPGDGPTKDEIVVVGAHLDHLGNGKLGADDNGSGSVAVMSTAYALSLLPPGPRTVVFQWYTAEESGLIGSAYYVRNPTFPKGSPSIRKHVAMVNLDMVGRLSTNYAVAEAMGIETEEATAEFSRYITDLKPRYPFASNITLTTGNRSDHARFRGAGVPAVWMFTGTHSDYHARGDVVSKINFDGLAKISRYCTELTYLLIHEGHAIAVEPFAIDEDELMNVGGELFRDHAHDEPIQKH